MGIRTLPLVFATLLLISTIPYPATAETPLADAGLDQTVTKGATVQLDATGSRDPDGTIEAYRWEIQDPDGEPAAPSCASCGQTTFTTDVVGTYEVTMTVTDDDGDTASDTLYVDVEPGEPPSLVLTGPTNLRTGQTGTYVAELDAGDAELLQVDWFVDGTLVDSQDVEGTADVASLSQQFPTATTYQVTARVVDTDGQTAVDTIPMSVSDPVVPDDWPNDEDAGNRGTATVNGPQLIVGSEPLEGTYTIDGTHVDSVTWWKDGTQVASGPEYHAGFDPGDHRVHAAVTYTDGTTGIARFGDGTTRVVADPEPTLDVDELSGVGGLTIDALASDEYGNLRDVEVRVYEEPLLRKQTNRLDIQKDDHGRYLEISTESLEMDSGNYEINIVATDARGQRTNEYRQIEIVGPPEVVRSEFEAKEDIDVYHPRIDSERYTVKHVVEIDLNGANRDEVTVSYQPRKGVRAIENTYCLPKRTKVDEGIVVTSCWASTEIEPVRLTSDVTWEINDSLVIGDSGTINATPSDPEFDIRVISGGAGENAKDWGLWIDASGSFDPDGTRLDYHWSGGAVPYNSRGDIGKLDSLQIAGLMVEDKNGGRSTFRQSFLRHFNPDIKKVEQVSNGPYLPGDDVVFVVTSEPYELPKNRYRKHVDIKLAPSVGDVVDRYDYHGEFAGDVHDWYDPVTNESAGNFDQIFWTVRVPAESFVKGNPSFETYHVDNIEETVERSRFPDPVVLEPGTPYASNIEIGTEYVVREPIYTVKSTVYRDLLEEYRDAEYQIINSEETGREWTFERKVKVSPAQFEFESTSFGSSGERSMFLELNPDWQSNGSKLVTDAVTRTKTEWRNSKQGTGQFTGTTRRQKVRSAKYLVEREYRYTYTSTESRTRTRTKTYQYDTTVEYVETVEQCNRYIGCYERTVTRTKSVTRTATREYEETYDITVTKSATYWASGKRDGSHMYTGASRRTLVQPAEYRTQYEFEFEETETTQRRAYIASITRLTEPAKYEWQHYQTTRSPLHAQELEAAEDVRRQDSRAVLEWTLRKQTGTTLRTSTEYSNESDVKRTNVEISGTIVLPYTNSKTGDISKEQENYYTLNYTTVGVENRNNIIKRFISDYMEDKIR